MEVKRLGNIFGYTGGNFAGNVYDKFSLSPTLNSMQGGNKQPMIIIYDGCKTFKNTENANAIILIDKDLDKEYWSRETYDLCPDCMREFEDFLKGKSYESD